MMTTLVVGPLYLGIALGLTATQVGFVMAVGPSFPSFRRRSVRADGRRLGQWPHPRHRPCPAGRRIVPAGASPNRIGVTGYVDLHHRADARLSTLPGRQHRRPGRGPGDRRGTVSGLISLSRNIGLIAGASAMGAASPPAGMEEFARATCVGHRLLNAVDLPAGGRNDVVAIGIAISIATPFLRLEVAGRSDSRRKTK